MVRHTRIKKHKNVRINNKDNNMSNKKVYEEIQNEEIGEFKFAVITGKGFKAHKRNDYNSYKVTLAISKSEAKRIKNKVLEFWEENRPKGSPNKPENLDSLVYYNKNTKLWTISPASRVSFDDRDVKIGIVDCDGEKLDPEVFGKIGEGSTGYVSMNMTTYDEGVSLFLNAVQLIDFVPYSGGSGDGSGNFSKKEGNSLGGEKKFSKKKKKKKKKD